MNCVFAVGSTPDRSIAAVCNVAIVSSGSVGVDSRQPLKQMEQKTAKTKIQPESEGFGFMFQCSVKALRAL